MGLVKIGKSGLVEYCQDIPEHNLKRGDVGDILKVNMQISDRTLKHHKYRFDVQVSVGEKGSNFKS